MHMVSLGDHLHLGHEELHGAGSQQAVQQRLLAVVEQVASACQGGTVEQLCSMQNLSAVVEQIALICQASSNVMTLARWVVVVDQIAAEMWVRPEAGVKKGKMYQ